MINQESFSIPSSTSTPIPDLDQQVFNIDELIRELFLVDELPWEYLHHRSFFLPNLDHFQNDFSSILPMIMSKNLKILSHISIPN